MNLRFPSIPFCSLAYLGLCLGKASAQGPNLLTNGDFSANAAAFTTWPAYAGGANPATVPGWNIPGGGWGVNGNSTATNVFGPVNVGTIGAFAFRQAAGTIEQNFASLAGHIYALNFDAAQRNNGATTAGWIAQVGGSTVLTTGNLSNAQFNHYATSFTGVTNPSQLLSFATDSYTGDAAANLTNVAVNDISGVWKGGVSNVLGGGDLNFAVGNLSLAAASSLSSALYFNDTDGVGGTTATSINTVAGGVTAGTLNFNASNVGYTLTSTDGVGVTGATSIIKSGSATGAGSALEMYGVNTYTGGTTISGGRARAFNPNALGTGTVTIGNGNYMMLWWNTGSDTIANNWVLNGIGGNQGGETKTAIYADGGGAGYGNFIASGQITLAATSDVGGYVANGLILTGKITGPGGLVKNGGNTVQIRNGTNDYAGGTTVNNGILLLTSSGSLSSGTVTVNAGGSFEFWTNPDTNGAGGVAMTLNNNLVLNSMGTGLHRAAVNQDGGAGLVTLAGSVTLAGDSRIGVGGGSFNDMVISGQVTGPGKLFVQERSLNTQHRVLVLSNNTNNYTGGTVVEGGVLRIDAPQALGSGAVELQRGATLHINASGTVANNIALSAADPFTLGETHTIYRGPVTATLTGSFTSDGGAGQLILSAHEDNGTNNLTFSGTTFALGAKSLNVTGTSVDGEGEAANSKVTLHNSTLTTTTGNVDVGRGTLEITGNTTLNIGGQLRSGVGGDWSRFVMNPGTTVNAPNGVNFAANGVIASSLHLNGGTLNTPFIYGNDFGGSTHVTFNGTTVVATAASSDFVQVHLNGNGDPHSAPALIANGGAILNTNGNDVTITNALSNAAGQNGSLTKEGTGTLTLTNSNNAFSGGVNVNGGTLVAGGPNDEELSGNSLGAMTPTNVVTVNNGGTLTGADNNWADNVNANPAGTASHSYVINAGGKIVNPANTVTGIGAVTLNGGTLEVNNGLGGWDAGFVLLGDVTVGGSTASNITRLGGATAAIRLTGFASASRTFTVADSSGSAAADLTVAAHLINGNGQTSGLTKAGVGLMVLSGNNSYTGVTNVANGELRITGSTTGSAYSVSGILSGTGSIVTSNQNVTLNAGGKLSPGASPGTLTMDVGTGQLDLTGAIGSSTGSLLFEVDSTPASSDLITLTGALNIGSGLLEWNDFLFTPGSISPGEITLIDSNVAIVGTLGGNLTGTLGGYNTTLGISGDGTNLILTVVPEPTSLMLGGLASLALFRRRRVA